MDLLQGYGNAGLRYSWENINVWSVKYNLKPQFNEMNMSTNYSMITMVPLHKRMEPAKHVNNNGAYSPGWNPRVFYQKSMTYYTIQGYGDIRFVFIESYRDRLLHLNHL